MKFIDEATLRLKAGNGGSGSRHFRREKFVPYGGPDGGNGGSGGSIYLVGDPGKHTLIDFKFQPHFNAESGASGEGGCRDGKSGEDLIIGVPLGTEAYTEGGDELVADIDTQGQRVLVAKGGRGGKGNTFFKSSTNQAPEHFQPGEEGQELVLKLSLKLIAEVGLVGLPNAGKSTFISRVTAARPKIADYPFTTLTPNLGTVKTRSGRSFVIADIPGLIPGAHEGKGLGISFLKHIERTKVIVHLIDLSAITPDGEPEGTFERFTAIRSELQHFDEGLSHKKELVILTKLDAAPSTTYVEQEITTFTNAGFEVFALSSVTGQGLEPLLERLADHVFG